MGAWVQMIVTSTTSFVHRATQAPDSKHRSRSSFGAACTKHTDVNGLVQFKPKQPPPKGSGKWSSNHCKGVGSWII